jgi:hypothetical protein
MKFSFTLSTSKKYFILFYSFSFLFIMVVQAQNCSSTQPNPGVCSGTVAEDFNTDNGSFTGSTGMTWNSVNGNWAATATGNGSSFSYVLSSAAYYKTSTLPNTVNAGFLLNFGNKIATVNILLEVVRNSDNVVLASCSQTGPSSGSTVCIGVTDAAITPGLMFRYRFTITGTTGNGAGSRAITVDNFSYGGTSNASLPVELTDFMTKRNGDNVSLSWVTQSESVNRGFEIERRYKQQTDFETIAFANSKALYGNSSQTLTYNYVDINSYPGVSYYRIKQVDLDGHFKYSEIHSVDGNETKAKTLVYPNPSATSNVNIVFTTNEERNIQLSDINGRLIKTWSNYKYQDLKIEKLTTGLYLVQINNIATNLKEVQRIVIVK